MIEIGLLSLFIFAACNGQGTIGGGDAAVPWSDYASGLQSRIDGLATAKDCSGLQSEFDVADANNAAQMSRTGRNNARLMDYIDTQMRVAGCH